jgi:hypothetical protein
MTLLKMSNRKRTYQWVDKDPICDVLRTMIQEDGRSPSAIAGAARLADATVLNILYGQTRKPQHTTVSSIYTACGYRMVLMADGKAAIAIPPYVKQEKL